MKRRGHEKTRRERIEESEGGRERGRENEQGGREGSLLSSGC